MTAGSQRSRSEPKSPKGEEKNDPVRSSEITGVALCAILTRIANSRVSFGSGEVFVASPGTDKDAGWCEWIWLGEISACANKPPRSFRRDVLAPTLHSRVLASGR